MASRIQSDQVYEELRRRILILEIRPEERLKEEEWAQKLDVGRLAVREALTRLHGEALVVRGPKGGFFAATMTAADVHEIREVREVLEVAALRLAGPRISKAEISELETTCDDFAYMVKKSYHTGACEADLRFHHLLVAASGNSRLQRAYDHCHIPLFQIRVGQSREYVKDFSKTEQEHRAIVGALSAGDIDRAIDLLRAHLMRGESEVLSSEPAETVAAK
jgi:DNA-binding GntR family transcriptional regulator